MFLLLMEFYLSAHVGNVVLSRLQVRKLFSAGGLTIKNLQEETGSYQLLSEKEGKIINDFHVAQFNKRDNLLTYTVILYLARNDREHVASARFTV